VNCRNAAWARVFTQNRPGMGAMSRLRPATNCRHQKESAVISFLMVVHSLVTRTLRFYCVAWVLTFFYLQIEKHFSFLDFIFGGLQLNFTVGCCSASFTTNPLKLTDKQDLLHGAQLPIATKNPVAPVDNHEMDPSQLCGEKNKQNAGVCNCA